MKELVTYLAWNSLKKKPGQKLRFDFKVMIAGIIISVAVVTAALNLFEGYQHTLKTLLLDSTAHIMIFPSEEGYFTSEEARAIKEKTDAHQEINSTLPVYNKAAIALHNNKIKNAYVQAYPQKAAKNYWYTKYTKSKTEYLNDGQILIGTNLASELGLQIGDSLSLQFPQTNSISFTGIIPKTASFLIKDIVKVGYYELDNTLIVMSDSSAFRFYGIPPQYSFLEINLTEQWVDKVKSVSQKLNIELGKQVIIRDWIDFNGNLFSLITVEKWLIFLVFSLLILIAALNCISSVSTAIVDRQKELALLQALGADIKSLKQIVYIRVLFLCTLSVLIGMGVGTGCAWLITQQNLYSLKGDIYFIDKLTTYLTFYNYGLIFLVSLLMIMICIAIPLRRIKLLQIIDILRGTV